MTIYYVDSAGSDTAPYDTWAKAAAALQTVISIPPAAGDIIYARGTGVLAAEIDLASAGTNAEGWIKLIGCNAAGNVDGTRYILDGNAAGINIFDFNGHDMWWLENIEVKNTAGTTKHGFYSSVTGSSGHVFINCCANTCSGSGFYNANHNFAILIRCISYSNTVNGYSSSPQAVRYLYCVARDNTADGFGLTTTGDVFLGCISHGNSDDGFGGISPQATLINCVIDGNADDGIELAASTVLYAPLIVGCRITNQSGAGDNGLFLNGEPCIVGWSYFEDNTDNINDETSALFQFIPIENGSTTTNLEDLANTGEGYVDKANHDFSTTYVDAGDPDLRRVAITLPWS